ncbi:MAG: hypothetical protein WCK13_06225 [Ignavibacteriota bacterium]|nr:hypothetical protein [Ignavibacteriota bacterium]
MINKTITAIIVFLFAGNMYAQRITDNSSNFKMTELTNMMLKDTIKETTITENTGNVKSPGISILLSVLLPGAGHYYAGRMDVGSYFLGAEVGMWLGLFGVNYYGNALRDDSRSYASVHSGLNNNGKDDDFYSNVGNYLTVYSYNNEKLQRGEYDKLYDINTHFWNWDSANDQSVFDQQRKKSERTYNLKTIFITGMIINRIVSGLSALILTNKVNNSAGSIKLSSEMFSTPGNTIDGIKLNFVKSF